MKEHVQDAADLLAHWVDAFNMVLNDEGAWDWSQVMEEHAEHIAQLDQLCALRKRWNKIVAEYNAVVARQASRHPDVHLVDLHRVMLGHGIYCRGSSASDFPF